MSQNDPQWGGNKNNNDGPPDLDQILGEFSKKLSRFFGGGASNQSGESGSPSPSGVGLPIGIFAVLGAVIVLWAASGFFVVDEREDALITRFGRYTHTVENSGLHWRLPWPVERSEIVNVTEMRSLSIGNKQGAGRPGDESMMLTADQNVIEVQMEIQYNLNSAYDFVFNNLRKDVDAKDIVKQVAETSIREVVGRNKVDYVFNEGRGKIAEDTKDLMQQLLNRYGMGVSISRVNLSDIQAPDQVQAAFSDAVKARQDRLRLINEGKAYANDVIPKASGTAARLTEEAEGYRQRVISRAEGDASRFRQVYTEYAKAPQVTRDRMYLDAMQEIYQNTSKVLVDQKSSGNLLYLPLDKLIQASDAPLQNDASSKPASVAPAEVVTNSRNSRFVSRDGR